MFFNVGGSETIFLVVGLVIGLVIAIIRARYWREEISEHEEKNKSLNKANKKKDAKLKDLNTTLQEYEGNIENLGEKLNQSFENEHSLFSQINKRDQAINQLKEGVTTLDGQLKAMSARAKLSQMTSEKHENLLRARARTLNQLQEAVNNRDREIQEWKTHSENTQTKFLELEIMHTEKEQDITTLNTRIRSMQDNLTIISGIGPKVSFVLRTAGITTFAKLAALNAKKIKKILEAENPRLLQLVDPTTWPGQAELASTGEWEVLKSLQDSLKGKRSTLAEDSIALENNQITTNDPTPNS